MFACKPTFTRVLVATTEETETPPRHQHIFPFMDATISGSHIQTLGLHPSSPDSPDGITNSIRFFPQTFIGYPKSATTARVKGGGLVRDPEPSVVAPLLYPFAGCIHEGIDDEQFDIHCREVAKHWSHNLHVYCVANRGVGLVFISVLTSIGHFLCATAHKWSFVIMIRVHIVTQAGSELIISGLRSGIILVDWLHVFVVTMRGVV